MSQDLMLSIAKQAPLTLTKAEWYDEIIKRAERFRHTGENQQSSRVRYATTDPDGIVLMSAYRKAVGQSWQSKAIRKQESQNEKVSASDAKRRLQNLADEYCKTHPEISRAQAMAKVLNTSEGTKLYQMERRAARKVFAVWLIELSAAGCCSLPMADKLRVLAPCRCHRAPVTNSDGLAWANRTVPVSATPR